MIQTLRKLFETNPCKKYVITGAPQCKVPDSVMDLMIQNAEFDALYVQFYNTLECSARTWVKGNSALNTTTGKNATAGFTYDSWVNRTSSGASKNAKIYLGLLGAPGGSHSAPGDFLWPEEATNLINTYVKDTRFGGVMLWDATWAEGQQVSFGKYSGNYYGFIKSVLSNFAPKTTAPVATLCPTTTSSSSSASKTSTT
jgi:chitinase